MSSSAIYSDPYVSTTDAEIPPSHNYLSSGYIPNYPQIDQLNGLESPNSVACSLPDDQQQLSHHPHHAYDAFYQYYDASLSPEALFEANSSQHHHQYYNHHRNHIQAKRRHPLISLITMSIQHENHWNHHPCV